MAWDGRSWSRLIDRLPSSFVACCGILALVVLAIFPLVAWYAGSQDGQAGVAGAVAAAGLCLFGGCAALAAVRFLQTQGATLGGLLLSIFFRTVFPLVGALFLSSASPMLNEGKVFRSVVMFYLVTLVVETVLSVRLLNVARDSQEVR